MNKDIYIIDWVRVKPNTIRMLESGKAKIINGVARNVSSKYQIIEHMPFKKVNMAEPSNLLEATQMLQKAQGAITGAVAISSVAIMGAIIVSTEYLSRKLDKIQETIETIQKELYGQNLIYYTDKISTYFGAVEATKETIISEEVVSENRDLIVIRLSELASLRNQLISFLNNLIHISDDFTLDHKAMAIDFINMTFDLLPKGVFIECQAAYKIERFYLGDNVRTSAQKKYYNSIENYRDWGNEKYRSIVGGEIDASAKVFQDKIQDIKSLISSEENKLLLEHSV